MKKIIQSAVCFVAMAFAGSAFAGGVVIAHPGYSASSLDAEGVRRAFLGREGSTVVIYQADGALRQQFDTSVLEKSGAELTTYWSRLIFTGRASAPREVNGDAAVVQAVSSTPNAVGYVDESAVTGSVKVLFRF